MISMKDLKETVNPPKSPDERRFIRKHGLKITDYPKNNRKEPITRKYKRRADYENDNDEMVYEEMTDKQKKKREEIVLSLKKKKDDFKKKYGDDWKDVMYATATKMAMNEAHQINWPDPELEQHAYNAIRHGMYARDAFDHVFSMADLESRNWMLDNTDEILDMFRRYGLKESFGNISDKETKLLEKLFDSLNEKNREEMTKKLREGGKQAAMVIKMAKEKFG